MVSVYQQVSLVPVSPTSRRGPLDYGSIHTYCLVYMQRFLVHSGVIRHLAVLSVVFRRRAY